MRSFLKKAAIAFTIGVVAIFSTGYIESYFEISKNLDIFSQQEYIYYNIISFINILDIYIMEFNINKSLVSSNIKNHQRAEDDECRVTHPME